VAGAATAGLPGIHFYGNRQLMADLAAYGLLPRRNQPLKRAGNIFRSPTAKIKRASKSQDLVLSSSDGRLAARSTEVPTPVIAPPWPCLRLPLRDHQEMIPLHVRRHAREFDADFGCRAGAN